ncbi:MAG: peptidylprolyl isomerase [Terriglobales bacterium]
MRLQLFVCLALVAVVCAQTPQPKSPAPPATQTPGAAPSLANPPAATAPEPPKVNPDDPVITIKGLCSDSSLQGDACKTVITKAQFEKMIDDYQPGMAVPMRRQFAMRYSQVLAMSSEAEKRHLDKSPHFEESLRLARMQILTQELTKFLQTDAGNVSDQDIQNYYQKNASNYEQATFIKIFVPHAKRTTPPAAAPKKDTAAKSGSSSATAAASKPAAKELSPEEQEKANEEAMKDEAEHLRARLLKGEDPDKLEKAAFAAAGLPGNPPPTKMEKVRRSNLPASQQSAVDLKPDEVSAVISDASGNYIYKLVSKETLPLDSVKTEIRNQLSAQHYREAMTRFQGAADLNDAYFGARRAPGMPMPGRPGAPPKDNDRD